MTDRIFSWIKANKWLVGGVVIAILNPIPSGVILGIIMITEKDLSKIGRIVLAISILLVVVTFLIFLIAPLRHR